MTVMAKYVGGTRIVRLTQRNYPLGLGMSMRLWVVCDLDGRKPIPFELEGGGTAETHLSRKAAAKWVTEQGWRYIGSQESES